MSLSVSLRHALPGLALDVAFEAPPGVTALFGPSGAGKTTVLNAVAGPATARTWPASRVNGDVLCDTGRRHLAAAASPPARRRVPGGPAVSASRASRATSPTGRGCAAQRLDRARVRPGGRHARDRRAARPAPGRALGRRTAAGGDRPGAAGPPPADAVRRTARRPRCGPQDRDPALSRTDPRRGGRADALRQPFGQRGRPARDHGGGDRGRARWCARGRRRRCSATRRSRPRATARSARCSPPRLSPTTTTGSPRSMPAGTRLMLAGLDAGARDAAAGAHRRA